jgi:hypothetical protein
MRTVMAAIQNYGRYKSGRAAHGKVTTGANIPNTPSRDAMGARSGCRWNGCARMVGEVWHEKVLAALLSVLMLASSSGCASQSIRKDVEKADDVSIYYGFLGYGMFGGEQSVSTIW